MKEPETYFRGGSVSWMMLGDISAEPYETKKALNLRKKELIPFIKKRLNELNDLSPLGEKDITIPFPGARGIKFILKGNDKERGTKDLIEVEGIEPLGMVFFGNELFKGGNDNMLRKFKDITLISVGKMEDPGVVNGGDSEEHTWRWLEMMSKLLIKGDDIKDILTRIRKGDITVDIN